MPRGYNPVILLVFLSLAGFLGGCGAMPPVRLQLGGLQGQENLEYVPPPPRPQMQIVAADRDAAEVARDVLLAQGSAADAAVALGFTLAVTSPTSAGLGAGGVCIARDGKGSLEAVDFRAARLPRGLLALHSRFGERPWSSLVVSAETMARFGFRVSPELAKDVETYGRVLVKDNTALASFMTAERRLIAAGDEWRQPWLSDTLAKMRTPRFLEGNPPRWFDPAFAGTGFVPAPGTTGFAVADASGAAVACAVSMGQPFGLGQMTRTGGYLFAASSPQDESLDQLALGYLACIKGTGGAGGDVPSCPAPASTFNFLP